MSCDCISFVALVSSVHSIYKIETSLQLLLLSMQHLPKRFRSKYLPSTACDMTLHGPSGKPWPVRYISTPLYGGLSGGWIKFTLHHNIEVGDVCVFELIKEKELKVHIFRVLQEIVPLKRNACIRSRHFVS